MLRILKANCLRLFWIHFLGAGWTVLLLAVVTNELNAAQACFGLEGGARMTKLLFWLLFSAMLPALYGGMSVLYGGPQDMVETLPLSQNSLNVARLLSALAQFGLGFMAWVIIGFWVPIDPGTFLWVGLFTFLLLVSSMLLGMRFRFVRFVLPVLVALIIVPDTERVLAGLLHGMTTPWASLVLLILTLSYGAWVLRQPPPRWTRGATAFGA
jgi:hypothetical protein